MDNLGTAKQFVIQRFPLFRGQFTGIVIYLDPQKQSVIERFPLLGEFGIRGSTVRMYCLATLRGGEDSIKLEDDSPSLPPPPPPLLPP